MRTTTGTLCNHCTSFHSVCKFFFFSFFILFTILAPPYQRQLACSCPALPSPLPLPLPLPCRLAQPPPIRHNTSLANHQACLATAALALATITTSVSFSLFLFLF